MKYLCVGYLNQKKMAALSQAQVDAVMSECPPFMEEFYSSGKVLLVAGTAGEAKSMQRIDGELQITDTPPGENHEMIGCVFLVEASNITEATQVAGLHPTTRIKAGEQLGFRIGISPVHFFEERALRKE